MRQYKSTLLLFFCPHLLSLVLAPSLSTPPQPPTTTIATTTTTTTTTLIHLVCFSLHFHVSTGFSPCLPSDL